MKIETKYSKNLLIELARELMEAFVTMLYGNESERLHRPHPTEKHSLIYVGMKTLANAGTYQQLADAFGFLIEAVDYDLDQENLVEKNEDLHDWISELQADKRAQVLKILAEKTKAERNEELVVSYREKFQGKTLENKELADELTRTQEALGQLRKDYQKVLDHRLGIMHELNGMIGKLEEELAEAKQGKVKA